MNRRFLTCCLLPVACCLLLSGCQAVRRWRAKGDASSADRLKQLEKQVEILTTRLEEVDLELRFNVALSQVSLGKHEQAVLWFQEIILRHPNSKYAPNSLFEIGKIYKYALKEPAKAVAAYEELLKRYPKSEFVRRASYDIAESLAQLKQTSKALDQYQSIITRFGKDPVVEKSYFDLGELYEQGKRFALAKESYEKLVELFPASANRPAALYRQALCSLALADTAAAMRQFEKVQTDFPTTEFAELAMFGRISALISEETDSEARGQISQYMIRYPNGRFRAEAERSLAKLDRKKSASP